MIEQTDPTQSDVRPLETDDLGDDELMPDPDGEAVVSVPARRNRCRPVKRGG
jgi:hypothetical protein